MKNKLLIGLCSYISFLIIMVCPVYGQLSGIKNIPGDYATISAAFAALNDAVTGGVCPTGGGVIFNVAAGSVYNETPLTLNITINKPTATAPIIFRKWGTGADPIVNITGTAGITDAGIKIVGTDYTTFDGLKINDLGVGAANWTEYGFAIVRASATDGCQYITIKNCTVDLAVINTTSTAAIYQANTDAAFAVLDPISAAGTHCYNKYFNNTTLDAVRGIQLAGGNSASSALTSFYDEGNEVGYDGGNNITFGGTTISAYGIYSSAQKNAKIGNNYIRTGVGHSALSTMGVMITGGRDYNIDVYNNNISVSSNSAGGGGTGIVGIYLTSHNSTATGVVNIFGNIIENCQTLNGLSDCMLRPIYCASFSTSTGGTLNVNDNIIRNNKQQGAIAGATLIGMNFWNTSGSAIFNLYGNEIYNNTSTYNFRGFDLYSAGDCRVYDNDIYSNSNTSNSSVVGINTGVTIAPGGFSLYDNRIYNLSSTGGGQVTGINTSPTNLATTSGINYIYRNTIYSLSCTGGQTYGIYLAQGGNGGNPIYNVYNNQIYSLSSANSSVYGIWGNSGTLGNIYNNFISDLQAPNGTAITGIYLTNNNFLYNIYNNSIYLNQTASISAGFTSTGINLYNCILSPVDVRNNIVVNTSTPGAIGRTIDLWAGWNPAPYAGYAATSDYNSYYAGVPGPLNLLFYNEITPASDQTLAAFKVRVAPRDASSISVNPAFFSPTDLHTTSAAIQNMGMFIAGYITDIDGQSRSNPPDLGADEINNAPDLGVTAVISPVAGACFSPTASITFQIKNYSSLSHNFAINNATINYSATGTNTSGQIPAGSYTINAGVLNPGATMNVTVVAGIYNMTSRGTYIFNASVTVAGGLDINISNNALYTPVTVVIHPPVSAVAGINPLCAGSSTTLYAFGASSYAWSPATYLSAVVGSSVTCTPLAGITYTITGTHANGCTSSSTLTVTALGALPLAGVYTIDNTLPTTYPGGTNFNNFTTAIYVLNCAGVSAPVTFNVISGQTFYESNMVITATGTAVNTITFQKSGVVHPLIYPLTGNSANYDGFIKLQGSDYITFDGIDLSENPCNTSATSQMEWGYALLKNSVTDGARYNVIRNCVITLNKTNVNTVGIFGDNVTPSAPGVQLVISNVTGANSFNRIYSNTVSNCYNPLWMRGSSTVAYYDSGNELGTSGANIITNLGGGASNVYGIYVIYHNSLKMENNTVTYGPGSTGSTYGIYVGTGNGTTLVNSNTISVFKSGTGGTLYGIYNAAADAALPTNITNNIIENCSYMGGAGAGYLWVFNNGGNASTLNYTGNISRNHSFACTANGSFWDFYSSSVVTTMNISNNSFTNSTASNGTGGAFVGIWPQGTVTNLTVSSNIISGYSQTSVTAQIWMYVMNLGANCGTNSQAVFGNNVSNCSNAYGPLYGIFSAAASTTKNIYSNTIYNFTTATNFSNVWGVFVTGGANNSVYNNIIHDLGTTATGSPVRGINVTTSTASEMIYGNEIYNLSCSNTGGSVEGISTSTNPAGTKSIYQNIIYNFSSSSGVGVYGISQSGGATVNVFKNTIYTLSSANATGLVYGLNIGGGTTVTASNNMIGNLSTPAANNINAINGIYIGGGTTVRIYYNSIYFNASSSGTNFGTSGIYATTVPTVELINNIFMNTSTPNGTGITVAHRRSNVTIATLTAATNYNYYFTTTTPDPTHLIFYDGVNNCQTIAAYKALAAPREQNSRWSNPGPIFTSAIDLHIPNNPQDSCISDKGIPIAGFTDDIDGDIRTATPDIGADEFAPLPLPVEILGFYSECDEENVVLSWKTVSETNNDFFTINRTTNGEQWEFVTTVKGAGNSNQLLTYEATDENPLKGSTYYRLSQTDYDGTTKSFGPIEVNCTSSLYEVNVYPNPFSEEIIVSYKNMTMDKANVKILDILGNVIVDRPYNLQPSGTDSFVLNLGNLAAGLYYIEFKSGDFSYGTRVVKN